MNKEWKILIADIDESIQLLLAQCLRDIADENEVQHIEIFQKPTLLEAVHLLDRTFLDLVISECISTRNSREEVEAIQEILHTLPLPPLLIYTSLRPTRNGDITRVIDTLQSRPEYYFKYLERPSDMNELELAILSLLGFTATR